MSESLEKVAEILRDRLPEFNVRILGSTVRGGELFNIGVAPKIAIELPDEHCGLRFTLLRELSRRTTLSFSSDSRSLNGACLDAENIDAELRKIRQAAQAGNFDGLTLKFLDDHTGQADRDSALRMKQTAGETASAFLTLAAAKSGLDLS